MEHLDIQLAQRLLRGELDPPTRDYWLRHADGCTRCGELLASERALRAILDLGQQPDLTVAAGNLERLLDRTAVLGPASARRRWPHRLWSAVGVLVAASLALLLAWQLREPSSAPEALVRELGITPELQKSVVARLDTLATLADDPWVAEQYDTVCALEQLIWGIPPE